MKLYTFLKWDYEVSGFIPAPYYVSESDAWEMSRRPCNWGENSEVFSVEIPMQKEL